MSERLSGQYTLIRDYATFFTHRGFIYLFHRSLVCTYFSELGLMIIKPLEFFSQLIAVNTFYILFLNMDPPKLMLMAMLFGGWSLIFTLVIAGPATMNTGKDGSFCMCFLFVVVVLVF